MFKNKKETVTIKDLKNKNEEIIALYKEIKKEAKPYKNQLSYDAINKVDLNIEYKSVRMKDVSETEIRDLLTLTSIIREALLDAQDLLKKGTEYGVQLAFNRILDMVKDREIIQSPFLVQEYRDFEKNIWSIIKLRELAYGEIQRLRKKQDEITKCALNEVDSMMRVRYFDDIRVLDKDILRLENDAHKYDTYQAALHSEKVLKNVLRNYAVPEDKQLELQEFENVVMKYGGKN